MSHCFADDIQIHMPLKVKNKGSLLPLLDRPRDINKWMSLNSLHLNGNKTNIVFGHPEL